ncbi:MAG: retroviral-like aspartic protease family protein [Acidobacteria bacterium]|nr:retroviral-like aspartic protease family protein [Acidobacteriota bacterium]
MLVTYGPTLLVDIGFDPNYQPPPHPNLPVPGIKGIHALVDTGATESCIDSMLATQLGLPVVDKRVVAGVSGPQDVNIHLAQVHIPSLLFTIYGTFAAVHLAAGGQPHRALIGRTFLSRFTMVYNGQTGDVTISS